MRDTTTTVEVNSSGGLAWYEVVLGAIAFLAIGVLGGLAL